MLGVAEMGHGPIVWAGTLSQTFISAKGFSLRSLTHGVRASYRVKESKDKQSADRPAVHCPVCIPSAQALARGESRSRRVNSRVSRILQGLAERGPEKYHVEERPDGERAQQAVVWTHPVRVARCAMRDDARAVGFGESTAALPSWSKARCVTVGRSEAVRDLRRGTAPGVTPRMVSESSIPLRGDLSANFAETGA